MGGRRYSWGAGGRDRPVGPLRVVARPRIRTETRQGLQGRLEAQDRLGRTLAAEAARSSTWSRALDRARTSAAVISDDVIRQVLPASEEDALAMASEMSYIRIPERGFINHRYGIAIRLLRPASTWFNVSIVFRPLGWKSLRTPRSR